MCNGVLYMCVLDGAGPLFGLTGSDQTFSVSSMTSLPSAYPLMAHPAFGLLSPATARPEFGGLGGLGVSAALAAHPQLGAFSGMCAYNVGGCLFMTEGLMTQSPMQLIGTKV